MSRLVMLGSCFSADRVFRQITDEEPLHIAIGSYERLLMIRQTDIVVFGGGEDISPALYNETPLHNSGPDKPSQRDRFEKTAFFRAQQRGAKMLGICRGAQMLCALNGGKLVQHVNGHGRDHWMATYDEELLQVTSVHHQMMWPFDLPPENFKLLGWTPEQVSNVFAFNAKHTIGKVDMEPEIVYFPTTKGLAIQGHPEFAIGSQFARYSVELTRKWLLNTPTETSQ